MSIIFETARPKCQRACRCLENMIEIQSIQKSEFRTYANQLFSILYDNMTAIVPSSCDRDEDFACWSESIIKRLKNDTCHMVMALLKETKEVVGYFQYSVQEDIFLMEEVEIASPYQGDFGIFRSLYAGAFSQLRSDLRYVEAYTNKKNTKSLGILARLGLSVVEDTDTRCHLRGNYEDLVKWFEKKESVM